MKMTSRRAATTLTAVAALSLALTACSGGGAPESDEESQAISVWFPGANEVEIDLVTDTIVPAFEEETGADVEVTFVDWGDLSPKLNAAFAAGTAPDVFGHGPAAVADFVVNDRVEDLGPYLDELDPADLDDLAAGLPGGTVDGVQYLIPLSMQGNLVMYNADDFTAAGLDPDNPPTTWEEARAAAEELTVRDGSGVVTHAGLLVPSQTIADQQSFAGLLSGAGGPLLNEEGTEAAFDSAEGEAALQYFVDLYQGEGAVANLLGEDYQNLPAAQQPLVLGTASMAMLTAPAMEQIVDAAPDLDLRVMPPLEFEDGDGPAAYGGAGAGLMINKDSESKDLAWEFIEYLTSPDVAAEYTSGIGAVPVRASAAETDYVQSSPVIQAFVEAAPAFVPNPNVAGWVQVRDVLVKYIDQALYATIDPAAALEGAAAEVDDILAANG